MKPFHIFVLIALPVCIILIGLIIGFYFSIGQVPAGKMCVPLNGDNESVNSDVYYEGTHLIWPWYHFSAGLPTKDSPLSAGVYMSSDQIPEHDDQGRNSTTELSVYIVFRFYVDENDAYPYFESLTNTYSSLDYEIETAFNKNASEVIKTVLERHNCTEYDEGRTNEDEHEKKWIKIFTQEIGDLFKAKGERFTLDKDVPIKAIFFFDGCSFQRY